MRESEAGCRASHSLPLMTTGGKTLALANRMGFQMERGVFNNGGGEGMKKRSKE